MITGAERHYEVGIQRHERLAPPQHVGTRRPLARISHYAGLFKRSVHLRFRLANLLSGLLPDFASGAVRGRFYRWAGFKIGEGAFLMGNLRLPSAAPGFYDVLIYPGSHKIGPGSMRIGEFTGLPVTIEDGAWIRLGAVIVPGVTIGRGSVVAAGAVVLKDVPPHTYVEGNPAQVIRRLPWAYR